jgi:hypothetical protein
MEANEDMADYVRAQRLWSGLTFGMGKRTHGITAHIAKELEEIRANPDDLSEWIDVMILAIDGYWRHGGSGMELMNALRAKQLVNFSRKWPSIRPDDEATEHIR